MRSLWAEKLFSLKQELTSIKNQAVSVTGTLESLIREMESLKPDIIRIYLEYQRNILARQRGFSSLTMNEQARKWGWAVGIGSAVLGGLLSKDPVLALDAGMSGFDALLRGMGGNKWHVAIDERISVVPQENINALGNWISWENIIAGLDSIKKKALVGERLGSFNEVITQIRNRYQPNVNRQRKWDSSGKNDNGYLGLAPAPPKK